MTTEIARGLTIATLFCLAGSVARPQSTPLIRTETRVVLVDAIVSDKKGDYVRDLAAKDFRLWEDNKEQVLQSVSLEKGSIAARPRYLVLFFAGIEGSDQILVRQGVSNFIDADAEENRKMAVVYYNGSFRIGQNFTENAARLKDAANAALSSGFAPSAADSEAPAESSLTRLNGRNARGSTAAADSNSRGAIRSLGDLARSLGVLPGRKIVVLLSGGLQSSSIQKAELNAAIEACNKSDVAVYPIDARPLSSQMGTVADIRSASEAAASPDGVRLRPGRLQGDVDDPGTVALDAGVVNQQLLFALASGTGGFVIPNSSQLQRGLQGIGEEQSEYYTLSYTPPESREGSCHSLRVKVNRGGTTVRTRSNYCATKPLDLLAGTSAGQDLERRAAGAETGSLAASMQLSYFYISANVARAQLAMEIPREALKFENRKGKQHAEIDLLGIATTADGAVGARFSDSLQLDSDNQAQAEGQRGKPLHYEKEFKIAPGRYNFAIAFGSGGESFGKLEMPFQVDSRMPGELALSSLVLSKETHPAAEIGLGGSLNEDRTPLIAEGAQIVPSGSNQFAKSEAGFFYLEVYAPDPAAVRLRLRVLDRKSGEAKSDSGPMKLSLPKNPGDAISAASKLPLEALAAGSYQLEVTAEDSAGKQVKRTADFEIR